MENYCLPTSLTVGGKEYTIRSDYRAVLDIFSAFNDPEFENADKNQALVEILYPEYHSIPSRDIKEAIEKGVEFLDCGLKGDSTPKPRTMDWEKDAPIIIPAINKVAEKEVRSVKYMHWWTFFGLYMEIGDCLFSQVLGIRQKKAQGKKLEQWEREWYRENKAICDLEHKEKQKIIDEINKLVG